MRPTEAIRYDASGSAACEFQPCGRSYQRVRRTQRFCSPECKAAFHDPDNLSLRGIVKSNKLLKGGKRSVTLHFEAGEDVSRLEPGKGAEIL